MKRFILAAFLMTGLTAMAGECDDITKCVEHVSKLTGKKYLFDARSFKGGLQTSSNTQITSENADNLFTFILDLNGYVRIPTSEKDTYMIVESRDLRYQALPKIEADAKNAPKLPENYDYYMMYYKFKNYKHGQMRDASNSLRPFMSRYARVIEINNDGVLVLQENAMKIMKDYDLIKSLDRELSKDEIKAYQEREKERKEERKIEKRDEKKAQAMKKTDDKKEEHH